MQCMDDLEKKALRKEIEELRAKLAKHEKGEFYDEYFQTYERYD